MSKDEDEKKVRKTAAIIIDASLHQKLKIKAAEENKKLYVVVEEMLNRELKADKGALHG